MSTGNAAKSNFGHAWSLQPGDLVGENYRIIEFIGEGAMGKVYRAKHELMPREYALKILNEKDISENSWRRFQVEAQAIARLSHPNVVTIYNLGVHNGTLPYYVMDLLDGETLYDRLNREENLEYKDALPLFIETCDGLGYAHKKGIVHRDIKPQNIVILKQQENGAIVRIVDFGIAKLAETKDPKNQMLTQMGEVFGTPFYMSPEQSMGERVDGRSDIYSLGCTLYETLCGTPPYRGINAGETMLMHQNAPTPSIQKACGYQNIPEDLETVINKMLEKRPMDRYQSMEALKHDLMLVLDGKPLSMLPYMPFTPTGTGTSFDAVGRNTSGMTTSSRSTTDRSTSGYSTTNRTNAGSLNKDEINANATTRKFRRNEDPSDQEYTMPPGSGPGLKIAVGLALAAIVGAGAWATYYFTPKSSAPKIAGGTEITDALDGPSGYKSPGAKPEKADTKVDPQIKKVKAGTNAYAASAITGSGTLEADKTDDLPGESVETDFFMPDMTKIGFMKEISADDFNPKDPKCSIHDRHKYSSIQKIDGVSKKVFDFPRDYALGVMFEMPLSNKYSILKDKVTVAPDARFTLYPGPLLRSHKEYVDRFQDGDIYGLTIMPNMISDDKTVQSLTSIPGLRYMGAPGCKLMTAKAAVAIGKIRNLKELELPLSGITGSDLAKYIRLQNLSYLNVAGIRDVKSVLRSLQSSHQLKTLNLSDCKLDSQDFRILGSLSNLETLIVDKVEFPTDGESALSRLTNLKTLVLTSYPQNVEIANRLQAKNPHLRARAVSHTQVEQ